MAPFTRILLAFLIFSSGTAFAQLNSEISSDKLGAGGLIAILALSEDDLKREKVRLSDAGAISFSILGEIRVKGLTVDALEETITRGLKGRHLLDPQAMAMLEGCRNYFVNGNVGKRGGYPFIPGRTARKSILIAGGFRERAARDNLEVIRDNDLSPRQRRVSLDEPVYPGDILLVGESFF